MPIEFALSDTNDGDFYCLEVQFIKEDTIMFTVMNREEVSVISVLYTDLVICTVPQKGIVMHEHEVCEHDLKYCPKCDVVYCNKCEREWHSTKMTWAVYPGDTTSVTYCTHEGDNDVDVH